jgi:outer membrane protein assembly factor BamB
MVGYVFVPAGDRVYKVRVNEGIELDWKSQDAIYPSTTVVVVGEQEGVYVGSNKPALYQLDFNTGETLKEWTAGFSGDLSGLAYADGVIYFTAGGILYGFMPTSQTLWSRSGIPTGALGVPGAGAGMVCSYTNADDKLYAISADGQLQLWALLPPYLTYGDSFALASKFVFDGNFLFAHSVGAIYKLNANNATLLASTKWGDIGNTSGFCLGGGSVYVTDSWFSAQTFGVGLGRFDSTTLSAQGIIEVPNAYALSDPIYDNAALLVSSVLGPGEQFLHAFDAASGGKLWDSSVPVCSEFQNASQACVDSGTGSFVFVTSENGTLYAFSRKDGKLAWSMPINKPSSYSPAPTAWAWFDPPKKPIWFKDIHQATIDPLWLLIPHDIYVKMHAPYPLPVIERQLARFAKSMTPAQRQESLERARVLRAYATAVEKGLTGDTDQ